MSTSAVVVDTSALLAFFDASEPHHLAVAEPLDEACLLNTSRCV